MPATPSLPWSDPAIARGSLVAAAVLGALAALAIVGTNAANATDLPGPAHETMLTGLQVLVGLGVLLALANGALGTGPLVGLAPVLAPALVIVAAMLVLPALGLTTPDTSVVGGFLLTAYVFLAALVFGVGGYAAGRALRWLVGRIPT